MNTKKVKVIKVFLIDGKTYKTAERAAEAWGNAVLSRASLKKSKQLGRGRAPNSDERWRAWHYAPTSSGFPYTADKARRRSLPIFQKNI